MGTISASSSSLRRFATSAVARPPPSTIESATRAARSATLSTTTTDAPATASVVETASPMPRPPPATIAVLPARSSCTWLTIERGARERGRASSPLLCTLDATATSGVGARGLHVWDGRDGTRATAFASLTVVGPSLAWADAFATAAFARGHDGLGWLARFDGYVGFAVRHDGTLVRGDSLPQSAWRI